jgi:hypothetical protein
MNTPHTSHTVIVRSGCVKLACSSFHCLEKLSACAHTTQPHSAAEHAPNQAAIASLSKRPTALSTPLGCAGSAALAIQPRMLRHKAGGARTCAVKSRLPSTSPSSASLSAFSSASFSLAWRKREQM